MKKIATVRFRSFKGFWVFPTKSLLLRWDILCINQRCCWRLKMNTFSIQNPFEFFSKLVTSLHLAKLIFILLFYKVGADIVLKFCKVKEAFIISSINQEMITWLVPIIQTILGFSYKVIVSQARYFMHKTTLVL